MGLLGTLAVNLTAKTEKFDKGMKRGRENLDKFQRRSQAASKGLGTLQKVLVGIAGAAALKKLVDGFQRVAEEVDAVAKSAVSLGIATEELSALGHAAQLSGSSVEGIGKVLEKMQANIGAASLGSKGMIDNFRLLGVELSDLKNLKPEEQLSVLADAIKGMKDQSEKMRLVQAIFGKSGAELIPLLDAGSAGIKKMTDEAKQIGATFTAEQAAEMEKFNDEMLRLKTLLGGKFRGFMIDISPAVAETIEGLNVLLKLYAPKTKIEAAARQNRRKSLLPTKDDSAIGRMWKMQSVNAGLLMRGLDWGMGKYMMPTGAGAATEEERNRFGNWRDKSRRSAGQADRRLSAARDAIARGFGGSAQTLIDQGKDQTSALREAVEQLKSINGNSEATAVIAE